MCLCVGEIEINFTDFVLFSLLNLINFKLTRNSNPSTSHAQHKKIVRSVMERAEIFRVCVQKERMKQNKQT